MGESKIEWTDAVWNPVTGCTKVSEGCRNCYAERMSKRLAGRFGYPADDPFKVTLHPDRLDEPQGWKKPRRIFVCSMGDLFHKDVPDEFIAQVLNVPMRGVHRHTYLILTKRPERARDFLQGFYGGTGKVVACRNWESGSSIPTSPPSNVHLGVSVEDQRTADERIPLLLETPAAKRFVSLEPMLGPVDLKAYLNFESVCYPDYECPYIGTPEEKATVPPEHLKKGRTIKDWCDACVDSGAPFEVCPNLTRQGWADSLDGIILGGESGPGARPMHPDWARKVRDDCKAAGVPFFFKQWGEWAPLEQNDIEANYKNCMYWAHGAFNTGKGGSHTGEHVTNMVRVGKKTAGALLDGKEHKEVPE